ncbi:hypothetical protein BDW02DRAFT_566843 [Decorospora gaudefroyi]|uniref:Uncharacterized protein n=1 Tax=Decorospora gaudefroyi TaxID=184978 RepID=A0A6A5KL01_9PLEO|nr:hypothetical protein BDW02DRAFT_566843 [Decorospora gaudefroyi]
MACNNWEKLCKTQRDYPKLKFAISFVDKATKKKNNNPFLTAWKADLSLRQSQEPDAVVTQVREAWQQPGSTDTRLLSYLYKTLAEATRRKRDDAVNIGSVGDENFKVWQNAAKALSRKEDRLELWSALGRVALREDCWEDFRKAVGQYNKEIKDNTGEKRHAHYTQVLATQLAAEQQQKFQDGDQKSQIQFDLARRLMKQAYEASPDDLIAIKDIRGLRFMAEVFARQDKCNELMELWRNPPAGLQGLMKTHRDDLMSLKTNILKRQGNWLLLEAHCRACIDEMISQMALDQESKCLSEFCAWRNNMWTCLLEAVRVNHSIADGNVIVSDIMNRAFGTELRTQARAVRLTYMSLRKFIGVPMLSDCKAYWEQHSILISCFTDLRPFVQDLEVECQREFRRFIDEYTSTAVVKSDSDQLEDAIHEWRIAYRNVLKFGYFLVLALAPEKQKMSAKEASLEDVLTQAMTPCRSKSIEPSEGIIGIYTLLRMHHNVVCQDESRPLVETTRNSRMLLQATMLARHLVAWDKEHQNRPLALLAARLHLNLGLGKCAFQLYSYVKCKEMLVHTLSPYVLSRISLTHPFGAQGYQGFSAEEELAKVISTMERMEHKIEDNIYDDMHSFPWDQAVSLLENKRRFKSSLTKHMCITERRRIARLKGELIDQLPTIDYKYFANITDNVDQNVFPNYESHESAGPLPYIMPNMYPNVKWMIESHAAWDVSSRVLYREGTESKHFNAWKHRADMAVDRTQDSEANITPAESEMHNAMWPNITGFVEIMDQEADPQDMLPTVLKAIPQELRDMSLAMEKLRMPSSTALKTEDEPTMFHENMLISCYTKLEVLRALNKIVEHLREKVVNAKSSHYLKAKLPKNWVNDLASETQTCFDAVRSVASSYIKLIEEKGVVAIKAQVRWGKTGDALREFLKDADVAFYAQEYVDSAIQSWKGVLQVKLK